MFQFVEIDTGDFVCIEMGAFGVGGFGGDQYLPASNSSIWDSLIAAYPHSPQNFAAKPGAEGPQVVLTWDVPSKPIHRLMIRRKLREYPRHPADGILVLDDSETPSTRTSYVDNIVDRVMDILIEFAQEYMNEELVRATIVQHTALFDILDTENDGSIGKPDQTTEDVFAALYTKLETVFEITISESDRAGIVTFSDLYKYLEPYDLLTSSTPGDCRWWYYRIFVRPQPAAVEDQFGGLGKQTLTVPTGAQDFTLGTTALDVQEFENITIIAKMTAGTLWGAQVYTSPVPMPDGIAVSASPATFVSNLGVGQLGENESAFISLNNASYKYIHVRPNNNNDNAIGGTVDFYFIVNRDTYWQTNSYLGSPCLAYRTGRHIDVMWKQHHLPTFLTALDDDITRKDLKPLQMAETDLGRVNLWEPTTPRGPLYRFLKLLSLELDRDHAYLEAMYKFDVDIFEAPEALLQHIAFELGWQVDTSRPLADVREELFRLAGFYKSKGRPTLIEGIGSQELGLVPRVQEGPGLVMRAANPALFD